LVFERLPAASVAVRDARYEPRVSVRFRIFPENRSSSGAASGECPKGNGADSIFLPAGVYRGRFVPPRRLGP